LFETLYVPLISHNLVSMSRLDKVRFSFKFGNRYFSILKHNCLIGSSILYDDLYKLILYNLFAETLLTLYHNVGTKRSLMNKRSACLWHKYLGHISKKRIERLVNNEILPNLDFTDLTMYVDCIKGKQTNT